MQSSIHIILHRGPGFFDLMIPFDSLVKADSNSKIKNFKLNTFLPSKIGYSAILSLKFLKNFLFLKIKFLKKIFLLPPLNYNNYFSTSLFSWINLSSCIFYFNHILFLYYHNDYIFLLLQMKICHSSFNVAYKHR